MSNKIFNTLIVLLMILGIINVLLQLYRLSHDRRWFVLYKNKKCPAWKTYYLEDIEKYKSWLSHLEERLNNQNNINRYIVKVLMAVGIVGALWGFSLTLIGFSKIIALSVSSNELYEILQNQFLFSLQGLINAFSAFLLGCIAALILGFLNLCVKKYHIRLINEFQIFEERKNPKTIALEIPDERLLEHQKIIMQNIQLIAKFLQLLAEEIKKIRKSENYSGTKRL